MPLTACLNRFFVLHQNLWVVCFQVTADNIDMNTLKLIDKILSITLSFQVEIGTLILFSLAQCPGYTIIVYLL